MVSHQSLGGFSGQAKFAEIKLPPVVGYFLIKEQFNEKRLSSFFPEVQKWVPMVKEAVLGVDAVMSWGYKGKNGPLARDYATRWQKPHFVIEDGYFRSNGLGVDGAKPLSITVDDLGVFYDATRPSRLEAMLLATGSLSDQQQSEAQELIELIRKLNLTKYNLPFDPFPDHLPSRDFILIADQTFQDLSVTLGAHNDPQVFERMLSSALDENPNTNIVIKTHPDVAAGKKQGCLKVDSLPKNVSFLTDNVSPSELFRRTKRLYTVTSQLGFEALLFGADVTTFGIPFYAGWGLTDDRRQAERRNRTLSLEQLAHTTLLRYCRYAMPDSTGLSAPLTTLRHLGRQRQRMERTARANLVSEAPSSLVSESDENTWTQGLTRIASAVLGKSTTPNSVKHALLTTFSEVAHAAPANNGLLMEWCAEQALQHLASKDRRVAFDILSKAEDAFGLSSAGRLKLAQIALCLERYEDAERSAHRLLSSDPDNSEAFDALVESYRKRGLYDQIISASSGRLTSGGDMSKESFAQFVKSVIAVGQAKLLADSILNIAPKSLDPTLVRSMHIELLFECKRFTEVTRQQLVLGSEIADHFDAAIAHVSSLYLVGQWDLGKEMVRFLERKWPEEWKERLFLRLLKKLSRYNGFDAILDIVSDIQTRRALTCRETLIEIRGLIGTAQPETALIRLSETEWKPVHSDDVIELQALALASQRRFDQAATTLSKGFAFQNAPFPRAHQAALYYLDAGNEAAAEDLVALAWRRVEEQVLNHNQPEQPDEIIHFVYLRRAYQLVDWLLEHFVRHGWPMAQAANWTRRQAALLQNTGSLSDYANAAGLAEVFAKAPKLAKAAELTQDEDDKIESAQGAAGITLGISNLFSSGAHEDLEPARAFYKKLLRSAEEINLPIHPVHQWRGNDRSMGGDMRRSDPKSLRLVWHGFGNAPNTLYVKDAALKGYLTVDRAGYAGWSSIASRGSYDTRIAATDSDRAEVTFQELRAEFVAENLSKYSQPQTSFVSSRPYVFFAMQMIEDTVSQNARIPLLDLADAVIDWAQDRGLVVVFKRHPRCMDARVSKFLENASTAENVVLSNESIHAIIPGAEAVFTVNSGVGLEALLHLKKVIISGRAEYESCCVQVSNQEELELLDLSTADFPEPDYIKRFLHVYARVYCCRADDNMRIERRTKALARLLQLISPI
ncbi:hypothetical protein [Nioella aestuarii]|uniref:capsular polysaccharide export protein, LipB/KpsS family n=1 Tax=Nioella aestuarii TaxID=1662864 RepID=UPI003D7F47A5